MQGGHASHRYGRLTDATRDANSPHLYLHSVFEHIHTASWSSSLPLLVPSSRGCRCSRGNGRCLDNEALPAAGLDFQAVSRLPGEQYSPDLQCQLALGTQYKAYYSAKQPFNVSPRHLDFARSVQHDWSDRK